MERFEQATPDKKNSHTKSGPKGDNMMKVSLPIEPQKHLSHPPSRKRCTHSHLIDVVLTPQGTHTGQLLCMECKSMFPDPMQQPPLH